MFVFDTSSWHYKLVLYVFGKTFFSNKTVDSEKIRKKIKALEEKARKKYPNDDHAIENALRGSHLYDDEEIYTFIPKSVNFCPYCRAVVWSVLLCPFAVISKLIPKRKKKPFDIKKSRRNTNIIKVIVIVIFAIWGTYNLIQGNYWMAVFQYAVGSFQIWGKYVFEWSVKWSIKREDKKIHKQKSKELKIKNPSLFSAYLKTHHHKICPPVSFVDKNDTEIRR